MTWHPMTWQAANVYGWTINDVHGQPALLYLVPGVLLSQLLRAYSRGEVRLLWSGEALPLAAGGASDTSSEATAPADAAVSSQLLPRRANHGWCCEE